MTTRRRLLGGAAMSICLGCADATTQPFGGTLEVMVDGALGDADDFAVVVDQARSVSLPAARVARFEDLEAGEHLVELRGLESGCSLPGEPSRLVRIEDGDTTRTTFEVACEDTWGALRVVTNTTGPDVDPNGYLVLIDDVAVGSVISTGMAEFPVPGGRHAVSLDHLAGACRAADEAGRAVNVMTGATTDVDLDVVCPAATPAGHGHEIAFTMERAPGRLAIYVMNEDGTSRRQLLPNLQQSHRGPVWSPDGEHIAFLATDPNGDATLMLAEADGRGAHSVPTEHGLTLFSGVSWTPDGQSLAFTTDEGGCAALAAIDTAGVGERTLLLDDTCFVAWDDAKISPDGSEVAIVVSVFDVNEPFSFLDVRQLSTGNARDLPCFLDAFEVGWSPAGRQLAVSAPAEDPKDATEQEIYLVDFERQECLQLTTGFGSNDFPAWSPDGSSIVFRSTRDGNGEIYRMSALGTEAERLTGTPEFEFAPSWRP